jgi:hypothetical protein
MEQEGTPMTDVYDEMLDEAANMMARALDIAANLLVDMDPPVDKISTGAIATVAHRLITYYAARQRAEATR